MNSRSSEDNLLLEFLYRYPWSSRQILIAVFGPSFENLVKRNQVRVEHVPGVGECWGMKQEKLSSIPGLRRREMAKDHIIKVLGNDALWVGGAPGPWGSDLLFFRQRENRWTRVWVDMGEISVEASPFVIMDPALLSQNVYTLILSTSYDRAAMIKVQLLALKKSARRRVSIFCSTEGKPFPAELSYHNPAEQGERNPLSLQDFEEALSKSCAKRLENVRSDQNIGKLFLELARPDFKILNYVGNNPIFLASDIAFLLSSSATGSPALADRGKILNSVSGRLAFLEKKGLIESAPSPPQGIKLSSKGLEVLSKYWGVDRESLRRFHAWPQKKTKDGDTTFSEKPLSFIKSHTQLVQLFALGLVDSSLRVLQEHGGADVFLEAIVGKRISYKDLSSGEFAWVIPDAAINISFWYKVWQNGHVYEPKIIYSSSDLLVEIDRSSIPYSRLSTRCEKYGRIWRSLSGSPVQIWVIDGSPWREKELLEMLADHGIDGWTVLLDRLLLDKNDPWWNRHSHKPGVLPYEKHGGMAPLRKIWRNTQDYKYHEFLGQSPWKKEMSQTKEPISVLRSY